MTMRISKYPPITGFGRDFHGVLPPSMPPVPPSPVNPALIPSFLWMAFMINHLSSGIFGKYTQANVSTEGLGDILAGYDWGMGQLHLPQAPVTATPSIALNTFAANHKYWMPSYAVQESPVGGALAMVGGGSAGAVAVSTPAYMISLQDCIDVGAAKTGLVAPLGTGFQVPSTRWVGFSWSDLAAGAISMAGDALSAVVGGAVGGKLAGGLGNWGQAIAGAAFGTANNVVQGLLSGATEGQGGARAAAGIAATSMILTAPAGIGLLSGQAADAVGGQARPNDTGPRDGVTDAQANAQDSAGS